MSRPLISRAVRNASAMVRANEWGDSSIPAPGSVGQFSGRALGTSAGLDLAASLTTVYNCVKVLYEDFLALPFLAYEGDPRGARSVASIQPQIVSDPFGPDVTPSDGIAQLVMSRAMRGRAYLYVVATDRDGLPTQVMVVHPDKVSTKWDSNGRLQHTIGSEKYGSDKVKIINGMTMPGAPAGMDPLSYNRDTLELAADVIAFADGYFEGGGDPSGVITAPGNVNTPKAKFIRDQWMTMRAGKPGQRLPAVLPGGATWAPMSVTPENMQMLATRAFNREEICGMFGVPLQRIQAIVENASQGGGKGVDAIDRTYIVHTLLPIAKGLQSTWNGFIAGGVNTWTGFDWDALLEAAAMERAQIAQIYRTIGVEPANEIRASEGKAPLRGPDGELDPRGDDAFQPINSNIGSTDTGLPGAAPATIPAAPVPEGEPNA